MVHYHSALGCRGGISVGGTRQTISRDSQCGLTIVGGVREQLVVTRRGRGKTVCARGADLAPSRGPSTSPLAVIHMRIATFVLLGSISLNAWGNSAMCGDARRQHADLLTPEQWQAVLNEKAGGDPVLEEAIAVEKYKYQERSPKSKDHIPIDWAQVR